MTNKNCLICNYKIRVFVDFGMMPIANAFTKKPSFNNYLFDMKTGFCPKCNMVQLLNQPAKELMFHNNYAFYSSTSNSMISHFKKLSIDVEKKYLKSKNDLIIEIGSNDGILIQNFQNKGYQCIGVEPSKNVADISKKKGINTINSFFDLDLANKILSNQGKAKIILSANVLCHIPYIHSIFEGIKNLMCDNGVYIFEDPYLGDVLAKTSFDQIYDEHVFLFSALSVRNLAKIYDLEIIDLSPQVTHGGSMRYTLAKEGVYKISKNVEKIISNEINMGLNDYSSFNKFSDNIDNIGKELINLLTKLKKQGKKVVGYGATSKSTTVNNYFNINSELIECIYDTTPIKHNTFTPGTNIPVVPYDGFHKSDPDYVLLYAWNHKEEILKKEKSFMSNNRKWISYIPKVEIF